ncbi:MAG: hypothetical protein WDO15_14250 [Bacteroidota bacterium]
MEYACAHACDAFTTVSDVTARECKHLLRRTPEAILPNGLNIQRFEVHHEFQNLHETYKERIHEFVIGHFFHSYSFDLEKTIYFFTSGRYEYKNKGFDLTLEALAHLNDQLKREKSDVTVIMFFVNETRLLQHQSRRPSLSGHDGGDSTSVWLKYKRRSAADCS